MKLDLPSSLTKFEVSPEFRQWAEDVGQKLVLSWLAVWATIYLTAWLLGAYTIVANIIESVAIICFLIGGLAGALWLIWLHDD